MPPSLPIHKVLSVAVCGDPDFVVLSLQGDLTHRLPVFSIYQFTCLVHMLVQKTVVKYAHFIFKKQSMGHNGCGCRPLTQKQRKRKKRTKNCGCEYSIKPVKCMDFRRKKKTVSPKKNRRARKSKASKSLFAFLK